MAFLTFCLLDYLDCIPFICSDESLISSRNRGQNYRMSMVIYKNVIKIIGELALRISTTLKV